MTRGRTWAAILVAALLAALGGAPTAMAAASTGGRVKIDATISYTGSRSAPEHLRLRIARDGRVVYNRPVTVRKECGNPSCQALAPTLRVLGLQPGGEPAVILSLWTGGANCCEIDQVFSWAPAAGTYAEAGRNFGFAGATPRDLDHNGLHEFVSADNSFKYEFTDGAASGLPLEIFRFSAGRFHDVTRRYPKLIRRDAALWLQSFKANLRYHDTVGLIAAWAADEELLGHRRLVSSYLAKQLREGHLTVPQGSFSPGGRRFVRNLNRFLRRHGYLR
jgi:hypothetical protein